MSITNNLGMFSVKNKCIHWNIIHQQGQSRISHRMNSPPIQTVLISIFTQQALHVHVAWAPTPAHHVECSISSYPYTGTRSLICNFLTNGKLKGKTLHWKQMCINKSIKILFFYWLIQLQGFNNSPVVEVTQGSLVLIAFLDSYMQLDY